MDFDTLKFMRNVGKTLGKGIKYEILGCSGNFDTVNPDYNKPYKTFHFEYNTNALVIDIISDKEMAIPMIKNNREAIFAAIFVAEHVDMNGHECAKIYGSYDHEFRRFTLTIQPYTDIDMENDDEYYLSLAFKGLSTGKDVDDLEDVFNNLSI